MKSVLIKSKLIKKIFAVLFAVIVLVGKAVPVSASTVTVVEETNTKISSNLVMTPYANVIVIKTRIYNGVRQYRRWNETRGYWVDANWINM